MQMDPILVMEFNCMQDML